MKTNFQFFGGRGARFGVSKKSKHYGTQYESLYEYENIKFVKKTSRDSEALMETMTKGRIYVYIGGEDIRSITTFGDDNKREVLLEKDKRTGVWHAHHGYEHEENDSKHAPTPTKKERKLIDRVEKIWHNHLISV